MILIKLLEHIHNRNCKNNKNFYDNNLIDYSNIPLNFLNKLNAQLLDIGITNYQSIIIYFKNQELFMTTLLSLDAFVLEIFLVNETEFEKEIKTPKGFHYVITDVLIGSLIVAKTLKILTRTVYVYYGEKDSHSNLIETRYMFLTSGTSGQSIKIYRSETTLIREALAIIKNLKLSNKDIILCNAPYFHSFGQAFGNFAACFSGASIQYLPSLMLPMHIIKVLKEKKFNILVTTPYYYNVIYKELSGLKYMLSAGGKLNEDVINSGILINNVYGSTETGAITIQQYANGGDCGSVGTPINGVEIMLGNKIIKINDISVHEILVKSNFLYDQKIVNNKKKKNEKEWYHTGDLGYFDKNNNLHIYGRNDGVLKINGKKISLIEIKTAIEKFEGIEEAKILHKVDSNNKIYIEAYVQCSQKCSEQQIISYCRSVLSADKIPRSIKIIEKFSRSEMGKIIYSQEE